MTDSFNSAESTDSEKLLVSNFLQNLNPTEAQNASNHTAGSYHTATNESIDNGELRILEIYDEILDLKGRELNLRDRSSENDVSSTGRYYLKQVCNDFNVQGLVPNDKKQKLKNHLNVLERKTAAIACRIVMTQEEVEAQRRRNKHACKPALVKNSSILPHSLSLEQAIRQIPEKLKYLHKAPVRMFSSLHSYKKSSSSLPLKATKPIQVNLQKNKLNALIQTDHKMTYRNDHTITDYLGISKQIQTPLRDLKDQETIYQTFAGNCKCTNTPVPQKRNEQATQMYEYITRSDLICLEWINKNLFRAPVNPYTVIVDEKIREPSELPCHSISSNGLKKEMEWERAALCT